MRNLHTDETVVRRGIERDFREFESTREIRLAAPAPAGAEAVLRRVCARPELRPFLIGVEFAIDAALEMPFRVDDARTVRLAEAWLANEVEAALAVRHALEVLTLQRLLPGQQDAATRWVVAGCAMYCAARYRASLVLAERARLGDGVPAWLAPAGGDGPPTVAAVLALLAEHREPLLAVQGVGETEAASIPAPVGELLGNMLPMAAPTECLLTQGGDNRLQVDPKTGLNRYGCSPKPRPWAVTFASSTGSSVSDLAFLAAERLRRELLADAFRRGLDGCVEDHAERIRRDVTRVLTLDQIPGTELVLASSGTDAELTALYFCTAGHQERLVNVVMAPTEVGSGTVPAAGGLHFDSQTPHGSRVLPGTPVAGLEPERIEVAKVNVRDGRGELLPPEAVDRHVRALVEQAVADGKRVLLHLLDSSKTGMGAPSIGAVKDIVARHGERVQVLVDAAQMRVAREALQDYVRNGFMVLVTGSKFFTGPPFAGALVLPMAVAQRVDTLPPLAAGLADYLSAEDFPLRWRALAAPVHDGPNIGSILRWGAALWEMKAFYAVPAAHQLDVAQRFLARLVEEIDDSEELELITAPMLDRFVEAAHIQWDRIRTIYSFFVKAQRSDPERARLLSVEEAQRAYRWLNMDISRLLPPQAGEAERRVAAVRCHIGQPVPIYEDGGGVRYAALRISIGARLISGVEFDPALGADRAERFETELRGALTALRKLGLIARHWESLACQRFEDDDWGRIDGLDF